MKKIKLSSAKLQLGKKVIVPLSDAQKEAVAGGDSIACPYTLPDPREACVPVTYSCASMVLGC